MSVKKKDPAPNAAPKKPAKQAPKLKALPAAAPVPTDEVSRQTLAETPARALHFLRGAGMNRRIRRALAARGYTEEVHMDGWGRLLRASGHAKRSPNDIAAEVAAAGHFLDEWDEFGFRIVAAALREFPKQYKAVLDGIGPSKGSGAIAGVGHLLTRIAALGASKDPTDQAAHAKLMIRLPAEERAMLAQQVAIAKTGASHADVDAHDATDAEHDNAAAELRAWYEEWSDIARAVVRRRDHLIQLGLAKRRTAGEASEGEEDDTPPKPAPADPTKPK